MSTLQDSRPESRIPPPGPAHQCGRARWLTRNVNVQEAAPTIPPFFCFVILLSLLLFVVLVLLLLVYYLLTYCPLALNRRSHFPTNPIKKDRPMLSLAAGVREPVRSALGPNLSGSFWMTA